MRKKSNFVLDQTFSSYETAVSRTNIDHGVQVQATMTLLKESRALTIAFLWMTIAMAVGATEVFSPEALYKQTVEKWQRKYSRGSPTSWDVWKDFAKTVTSKYEEIIGEDGTLATNHPSGPSAVEIVGAIEEGILTIERIAFQQQEGPRETADIDSRDSSLAILYQEYGRLLLYSSETTKETPTIGSSTHRCYELAKDPHTLLIGAPERVNEYFKKKHKGNESNEELLSSLFGPLCRDNAENALRNAISLDASCEEAETLLDVITRNSSGDQFRKPKEFVAELFDSFADTFDEKLTKTLGYRAPQIIGSKVAEILDKQKGMLVDNVLDAGCGTGLAGRELRNAIDGRNKSERIRLIGVDASRKMLEIAGHCTSSQGCGLPTQQRSASSDKNDPKLYDALIDLDLEAMTLINTKSESGFDLIVAADVFVYFGSLERILEVFSTLQKDRDGMLVFTCERVTTEQAPLGYKLMPTGRFAHTKDHVLRAASASGYEILDYSEIIPRTEKGSAVDGHLFVFSSRKAEDAESEL